MDPLRAVGLPLQRRLQRVAVGRLRAGLALSLPTFEEYRARLAALERDLARAALDAAPINTARSAVAGRPIRVSV